MAFLYVTQFLIFTNGTVKPDKLFEPPFTEIADSGVLGVFNQQEAKEVVDLIDNVNRKAVAV